MRIHSTVLKNIKAYAKVNLFLDVLQKREDGYHNIETLIQEIELADDITIQLVDKGIRIRCDDKDIPTGSRNTVYKAVQIISEYCKKHKKSSLKRCGVDISIRKNIPVSAGLGGGSSDAAAVLCELNHLWRLDIPPEKLQELGARIGMDVPFFIKGGIAYCFSRGEKVQHLQPVPPLNIVMVNPGESVSTRWVYQNVKLGLTNIHNKAKIVYNILARNNVAPEASLLTDYIFYNALEKVTIQRCTAVGQLKADLKALGSQAVFMSGSGPTVVGITDSPRTAEQIREVLLTKYNYWVWVGRTTNRERRYGNGNY